MRKPVDSHVDRPFWVVILAYTIGYLGYYLTTILFLVLSLPLVILLAPFAELKQRLFLLAAHGYARFLTQGFLKVLDVCHIDEIEGMAHCPTDQPFVCVSNHRGRLDALLLIGFLKRTSVLIKAKHARFPMLAHLVRHSGFISVDQSSPASMALALQKCGKILDSGTNLLVFPEGSRAAGRRLLPFGSIAFKVACDRRVPIVPVIIYAKNVFMAKRLDTFYPRRRIGYRIHFLPPVIPNPHETPAVLSDRVYRGMIGELKLLQSETTGQESTVPQRKE